VNDLDGQFKSRSDLDELLGISTTSMDFDVSSVEGETHLEAYMQVQLHFAFLSATPLYTMQTWATCVHVSRCVCARGL